MPFINTIEVFLIQWKDTFYQIIGDYCRNNVFMEMYLLIGR